MIFVIDLQSETHLAKLRACYIIIALKGISAMKRYKAFLAALMLLAALTVLSACGGGRDNTNTAPVTPPANSAADPDLSKAVILAEPGHGTEDGGSTVITAGNGIDDAGKITLGAAFTGVLPGDHDDWYRFVTSAVKDDTVLIRLTNMSAGSGRIFLRLYDGSKYNLLHLKAADDGTAVSYTTTQLEPATTYYVKLTCDSKKDPVDYKLSFISLGGYDEAVERIKRSIIDELRAAMSGNKSGTGLSEDGELIMANNVLFDENKYVLKAEGKAALDEFCSSYLSVLLSNEYIDALDSINFEGYADPIGDPASNEELSLNRAKTVLDYCLQSPSNGLTDAQKELLRKKAAVAGYGSTKPVTKPDGSIDYEASRRVEVSFVVVIPTN